MKKGFYKPSGAVVLKNAVRTVEEPSHGIDVLSQDFGFRTREPFDPKSRGVDMEFIVVLKVEPYLE